MCSFVTEILLLKYSHMVTILGLKVSISSFSVSVVPVSSFFPTLLSEQIC